MTETNDFRDWVGKEEVREDRITPVPLAALSATLDRADKFPVDGDPVPLLWSWLYFLPLDRQSDLGPDGHARRGGFLPPVTLPRRMWAGGRLEFHRDLRVGAVVTRSSKIISISEKPGVSGPLVFIVVRHEIADPNGLLYTEEHDIVYLNHGAPDRSRSTPRLALADQSWVREVKPNDVLLFRYSALTFNGHRIHYDRRYAVEVEKYPGLVVHGPLIATLLLELVRQYVPDCRVASFSFRAINPLFDTSPFFICGTPVEEGNKIALWATDPKGNIAMEAMAEQASRTRMEQVASA